MNAVIQAIEGQYSVHGRTVEVSVDPCSSVWRLQVSYAEGRNGVKGYSDGTVSCKITDKWPDRKMIQSALDEQTSAEKCIGCNKKFLKETKCFRKGRCPSCHGAWCTAKFDQESAKERDDETKKDKSAKAKGFRYKALIWVHAGGDDYQLVMYSVAKPSDAEIKTILKKKKSRVLNDYTVTTL